jgi:creatinine amidohydrolase
VDLLTTATSADEAQRRAQVAVLPVGSFEQHGDHLPLITDTVVACTIAKAIADRYGLFLLPPVTISCSHEHAAFSGTVSIRASTLSILINDITESLARSGVPKLVVVNGHGGNYVLGNVVQELNESGVRALLYPGPSNWARARTEAAMQTNPHEDMHGGELETSVLLHVAPSLIGEAYADKDHVADERALLLTLGMSAYTPTGIVGRPSLAEGEKGKRLIDSLVDQAEAPLSILAPN